MTQHPRDIQRNRPPKRESPRNGEAEAVTDMSQPQQTPETNDEQAHANDYPDQLEHYAPRQQTRFEWSVKEARPNQHIQTAKVNTRELTCSLCDAVDGDGTTCNHLAAALESSDVTTSDTDMAVWSMATLLSDAREATMTLREAANGTISPPGPTSGGNSGGSGGSSGGSSSSSGGDDDSAVAYADVDESAVTAVAEWLDKAAEFKSEIGRENYEAKGATVNGTEAVVIESVAPWDRADAGQVWDSSNNQWQTADGKTHPIVVDEREAMKELTQGNDAVEYVGAPDYTNYVPVSNVGDL